MNSRPYNLADDFADRDMDARHDAARSEESKQRFRDFSNNADALAASLGFAADRSPAQTVTFEEIQTSRAELVGNIRVCELLDARLRDGLAFELKMVDTTTHGTRALAGRTFQSVATKFRDVVALSFPGRSVDAVLADNLELKWIAEDLQWLVDRMTFLRSQ